MRIDTAATPEMLQAFETVPDLYLILSPELVILTASDAYLRATFKERESIRGKSLFEVFPDNPALPASDATAKLGASLAWVLLHKQPHQMALQRYDVALPEQAGVFTEKYWLPTNTPVLDKEGAVQYIIHKVVDVTEHQWAVQGMDALRTETDILLKASRASERQAQEQANQTQHVLQHLNQELEERVAARTRDLQEAKAQIEAERNRLHHLFMQAPAPIVVLDGPQLMYEVVNPAYQQMFPGRELLGKPVLEALPELAGTPILAILKSVYSTGETFVAQEMPLMLSRHQGAPPEQIYFTFTYQARQNQSGAVDGVLVFAYYVTDQVQARQRIAESEEKYRSLFQTMDQGFCIIEMIFDAENRPVDYRFQEYNQMFEKHSGLVGAVGKTARELVPGLEPHWFEIYGKVARTGEPIRFTEGSAAMGRWFEVYAYRLGDGSIPKVSLLFSDITQRKQAEEELKINNQQLKRINNDLDNFIYTASHDLKTPILNIEVLLDALLSDMAAETVASERVQQITGMMQESVERFKKTIANLTEVVKLQKDNSGEAVRVDVKEVIREVLLDLEQEIRSSGAHIIVDVAACPAIHFSEKNLRSVVYNLLSNALKFRSPEREPRVQVHCQSLGEYLVLSVQDNGLGMDTKGTDQLFTMFKRFHDHVEGSGIGLYMIKRMMDNVGGQIELESQLGEGSTFRVYFPR
ncbi:hypothetical protein BH24BAC1_BH24BAC1_24450 [soil metagenome]